MQTSRRRPGSPKNPGVFRPAGHRLSPAPQASARAERIARTIDAAGVRSTAVPDILSREWTKFVGWAGLMLMSITTRSTTWKYLTDPDCALVLVRLVREVAALAQASGVALTSENTLLPLQGILGGSEEAAVQAVCQAGHEFRPTHPGIACPPCRIWKPAVRSRSRKRWVMQSARPGSWIQLPLLDALYHLAAAIDRTRRTQDALR